MAFRTHRYTSNTANHSLRFFASIALAWVAMSGIGSAQNITTVAGGYLGEGVPTTEVALNDASGVFLDGDGNLYIADTMNNRVRKVDASGAITTVAGGGTASPGNGGPATEASLNAPVAVFADGSDNLYIAESSKIRKVDSSGTISTIAGGGSFGNIGDGGPAIRAFLNPSGIYVDDSGNLYIADNQRVRKVDASGTISTVAGNGTFGFSGDGGPATEAQLGARDVFVDGSGNLYIADSDNNRIRKVDPSGIISTVAGGGNPPFLGIGDGAAATDARLNIPSGVYMDGSGNLYIADRSNHRIRKVDPSGIITTVAGNGTQGFSGDGGPGTEASLNNPSDVFGDGAGNLYIADLSNRRIRKVDTAGTISTVAGGYIGDGGPATQASLISPQDLFLDSSGNIYIADKDNHRIRKVDPSGTITTIAGGGSVDGDGGPATEASLSSPAAIFLDGSDNLYIVDTGNGRIRKVDAAGAITTVAGGGNPPFPGIGDGGPATDASLILLCQLMDRLVSFWQTGGYQWTSKHRQTLCPS